MAEPQCGTVEGYRAHRRREERSCQPCWQAMADLMHRVRAYQGAVRGQMPAVAPQRVFSAHQRSLWPQIREAERAAALAEHPRPPAPPRPYLERTVCTGTEDGIPGPPRTVLKRARAAGWWAQMTRAIGPRIDAKGVVPPGREQVGTVVVAAARGEVRLTWLWHYIEKTKGGVLGWHWELDEVFSNQEGIINDTRGKAVLDG